MVKEVYIVRHGNTFDKGDIVTRVGARTDLPLSQSGQAQAKVLAEHFKSIKFQSVYCSPLLRTQQTAKSILSAQSLTLEIQNTDFLKEIDYGPDENRPESEVIARIGQAALTKWDEASIPPDGWLVDPGGIISAWSQFFETLLAKDIADPVLVVTSNGVARFVLDAVQTMPAAIDRKLSTAAYGLVTLPQDGPRAIKFWNRRA